MKEKRLLHYWFKLLLVLLMFVGSYFQVAAQYENVWVFGEYAGLDFNNSGSPKPFQSGMFSWEACANICDNEGNLMFYTDGTIVFNRNHDTMPNGQLFHLSKVNKIYNPTTSTNQGVVIVPNPGNCYQFYIFSLKSRGAGMDFPQPMNSGRLSYSVVDIRLRNGLGDVLIHQKDVYLDTLLTEQMTSIPGINGEVWLITSYVEHGRYMIKSYNINCFGVNTNPVTTDSLPLNPINSNSGIFGRIGLAGFMSFSVSNDNTKLVDNSGKVTIYDFNRLSGRVTNPVTIPYHASWSSSCFSPDNSKLYALGRSNGDETELVQFNFLDYRLSLVDSNKVIIQSKKYFGVGLKLGPDNKIYILGGVDSSNNNSWGYTMSIIHEPNKLGLNCNTQVSAFQLYYNWVLEYQTRFQYSFLPNRISLPQHPEYDTMVNIHYKFVDCELSTLPLLSSGYNDQAFLWDNGQLMSQRTISEPGKYWVVSSPRNYCDRQIYIDTFYVAAAKATASCYNQPNGSTWLVVPEEFPNRHDYTWISAGKDTFDVNDTLRGMSPGKYYFQIVSPFNTHEICLVIDTIKDKVTFDAQEVVCQGSPVLFTNTSDPHYDTFKWYWQGSLVGVEEHLRWTQAEAGYYEVQSIGRGNHCTDTFTRTIIVDSLVPVSFQSQPDSICTGERVVFSRHTDSSIVSLDWSFGTQHQLITADVKELYHAFDEFGVIPVSVNTRFRACPDVTFSKVVYVYPIPTVDFGMDTSLCLKGEPIYLKNIASHPLTAHRYLWNTGDTTPMLKVVHPGRYELNVIAAPIGCIGTEQVYVSKGCTIDIPNAFSPNNDGVNDYFFPVALLSENLLDFRMMLFNRWGQLLFESNKIGRGWDGKFNNVEQENGVYLYRINVSFVNGIKEDYEGNVTLLR